MTDSSTGGYLIAEAVSVPTPETEDDAFLDFLHDVIAGITGMGATLVRPRYQPNPPTLPPKLTNWVAFGITDTDPDQTGYEAHFGEDEGRSAMVQYEDVALLLSFYGPGANNNAKMFRLGLLVGQNREALTAAQVGVKRFSGPTQAPLLVKEEWLYRTDLTVTLRRQIRRVYPILNILQGVGTIEVDKPPSTTPFVAGA